MSQNLADKTEMYYPRSLVTAKPEDEDDSAPLMDVVVREGAVLLQLPAAGELLRRLNGQPLLGRGDPLLVLQRLKVKDSRARLGTIDPAI